MRYNVTMKKDARSSYFYHFLAGVASINLFPNGSRVMREMNTNSDKEALYSDWLTVGNDMNEAINSVSNSSEEQQEKHSNKTK